MEAGGSFHGSKYSSMEVDGSFIGIRYKFPLFVEVETSITSIS